MKATFASTTTVTVERSKAELDALLAKHGAQQRAMIVDDEKGRAAVSFVLGGAHYRLEIPLPSPPVAPRWGEITPKMTRDFEQSKRTRWRAVILVVKAKLEFVAMGVSTVEREFLADLVLPSGDTMHVAFAAKIREAISSGVMPPLMLPEARP